MQRSPGSAAMASKSSLIASLGFRTPVSERRRGKKEIRSNCGRLRRKRTAWLVPAAPLYSATPRRLPRIGALDRLFFRLEHHPSVSVAPEHAIRTFPAARRRSYAPGAVTDSACVARRVTASPRRARPSRGAVPASYEASSRRPSYGRLRLHCSSGRCRHFGAGSARGFLTRRADV